MADNPYASGQDYQFWRRAVSRTEAHLVDPVTHPKFTLTRTDRIATAGSCFAQHISRRLDALGFNYFVPEAGDGLEPEERARRQYGVFSARYGNLYTVQQLNQLFREAMHGERKHETAWQREDGRYVDPYRPTVAPEGYASPGEVAEARAEHLGHVRQVFAEADIFVFTLGLTEAWRSREDGAVFPLGAGRGGRCVRRGAARVSQLHDRRDPRGTGGVSGRALDGESRGKGIADGVARAADRDV